MDTTYNSDDFSTLLPKTNSITDLARLSLIRQNGNLVFEPNVPISQSEYDKLLKKSQCADELEKELEIAQQAKRQLLEQKREKNAQIKAKLNAPLTKEDFANPMAFLALEEHLLSLLDKE